MIEPGERKALEPAEPNFSGDAPASPRGVVVPRRRPRPLRALAFPLAIAALAGAVLAVRMQVRDWRGLPLERLVAPPARATDRPEAPPARPSAVQVAEHAEVAPPGPESAEPVRLDPPEPEPVEVEVEAVEPPRPEPEPTPAAAPEPTPPLTFTAGLYRPMLPEREGDEPPDAAAPASPPASAGPGLLAIEHEAERLRIERERLDALKAMAAEQQREAESEEDRSLAEARRRFLERLREVLGSGTSGTAEAIRRLADELPDGELVLDLGASPEERAEALSASAEMRRTWVAKLRAKGVSERVILEEIARAHAVNRVARTGPRNHDEALIRAARDLLSAPDVPESVPPLPEVVRVPPHGRPPSEFGPSRRR
jgi:hypothetical protein